MMCGPNDYSLLIGLTTFYLAAVFFGFGWFLERRRSKSYPQKAMPVSLNNGHKSHG